MTIRHEACKVPTVSFGDVKVPRLILGHLPFLGESYQGPVKNLEYTRRFSHKEGIMEILSEAVERYGITVMGASTLLEGEAAGRLLEAITQTAEKTEEEISLVVCVRIPLLINGHKIDDYRRWLTYYEVEKRRGEAEVLQKYLDDPILQSRENWRSNFLERLGTCKSYRDELGSIDVDYEKVDEALNGLRGFNVLFIVLGSEVDLLAIGGRLDLLNGLIHRISDAHGYRCLVASHHAGSTIPILENSGINIYGYLTSANRLGVMMFPTQKLCEEAIRGAKAPIIAIKPLAGGRIPPRPSLRYIYDELNITCCMVGVASKEELEEAATAALEILSHGRS
ncbi:MAG: hypothetical protein ACUVTM_08520 [Candidatus Bathyarchaeia archaeon]